MKKILLISPDRQFCKDLGSYLETLGYSVSVSDTLEEVFFRVGQPIFPFIVIDQNGLSPDSEDNEQMLSWFRLGSKLIFLATNDHLESLQQAGERAIRKDTNFQELINLVRELAGDG